MNTQSIGARVRRISGLAALAVVAGILVGTSVASAKTPRDRGPWERLDLTKEQREKVREIAREHREASRKELHEKLSAVLTEDQLEQLEKMDRGRKGGMWDNRPGRPGRPGRREFRGERRWQRGSGGCECDRGGRGEFKRGHRGGHGSGPRMGEMREERGARMVERLAVVLDLTATQQEQVATIVQEHQAQFRDFDRSRLTFEERQETRDAHRMLLGNRIKEVLTDAQKEKYDEFMKTMPGPRRGGRGKKS